MNEQELIKRAMSVIGSRTSERKAKSSAANGRKFGGRPKGTVKPLADFKCTCGAGDSLQHKSSCPRGKAIRRREAAEDAADVADAEQRTANSKPEDWHDWETVKAELSL